MPETGSFYMGTGICPAERCDECPADATAAWGYIGSADRYSCGAHDPLAGPGAVAAGHPHGFWYRSLLTPLVTAHSTGHFAGRGHGIVRSYPL